MSIRIDNSNIAGAAGSSSFEALRGVGGESRAAADGEDRSTDSVKLSSASNLVGLAKNFISADRESKIARLAGQVRAGTYQVNLNDVSRAMLEQMRQVFDEHTRSV